MYGKIPILSIEMILELFLLIGIVGAIGIAFFSIMGT
jgi:hypothetical protein